MKTGTYYPTPSNATQHGVADHSAGLSINALLLGVADSLLMLLSVWLSVDLIDRASHSTGALEAVHGRTGRVLLALLLLTPCILFDAELIRAVASRATPTAWRPAFVRHLAWMGVVMVLLLGITRETAESGWQLPLLWAVLSAAGMYGARVAITAGRPGASRTPAPDRSAPDGATRVLADDTVLLELAQRPIRAWAQVFKELEDRLLAAVLTLLLLPLLGLIALCVRLSGPGPVLYRQRRHTLDNCEFDILKFRTMHWQAQSVPQAMQQTQRRDARITAVGHLLRLSSLDELPQLFNVLQGHMSLVGPRPHAIDMRTASRLGPEIIASYAHRHRIKPGITGWAQVNGARGATDTEAQLRRRIELDLYYIEHWSPWLDLKILLMTFKAVVKGTNAY